MTLLYIALGGAIGSVLRHSLTVQTNNIFGSSYPYGTIVVNILGSFLMGILIGYLVKTLPNSMEMRSFLAVGLLGGFTTFSAFTLDIVNMIERGNLSNAIIYIAISVIISIMALFLGLQLMRSI